MMSMVYGRWEVVSGPTMGYNLAIQGNVCANAAETLTSETANYSSSMLLAHDTFMKAVAAPDATNALTFPSYRALTPQDTVIRGLSSLSLHPQSQLPQAIGPSADFDTLPPREPSSKPLERKCSTQAASNERSFCGVETILSGCYVQSIISCPKTVLHHCRSGATGFEDVCGVGSVLSPRSCSSDCQGSTRLKPLKVASRSSLPRGEICDVQNNLEMCCRTRHKLNVVVEDKPYEETLTETMKDDLDLDTPLSSSNSISSLYNVSANGSISSDDGIDGAGDSEVHSVFKGSSSCNGCKGDSPPRKGLSRFYAGKSRSFSCLADAMSVSDLAKPENPYAKKRRCHASPSVRDCSTQLP